jgi:hypothetical protein
VPVNMVKCNASAVEIVCSGIIHDYRKHASDQHSSAYRNCLWRQVCRCNQYKNKFKTAVCAGKVMLIVSWNVKGLVHSEFMPTGMIVNCA